MIMILILSSSEANFVNIEKKSSRIFYSNIPNSSVTEGLLKHFEINFGFHISNNKNKSDTINHLFKTINFPDNKGFISFSFNDKKNTKFQLNFNLIGHNNLQEVNKLIDGYYKSKNIIFSYHQNEQIFIDDIFITPKCIDGISLKKHQICLAIKGFINSKNHLLIGFLKNKNQTLKKPSDSSGFHASNFIFNYTKSFNYLCLLGNINVKFDDANTIANTYFSLFVYNKKFCIKLTFPMHHKPNNVNNDLLFKGEDLIFKLYSALALVSILKSKNKYLYNINPCIALSIKTNKLKILSTIQIFFNIQALTIFITYYFHDNKFSFDILYINNNNIIHQFNQKYYGLLKGKN